MRLKLANSVSNVFNPILLSLLAILLLSLGTTESLSRALVLSLVVVVIGVVPVYLLALYLVRSDRLESVFNSTRQQRRGIYIAGIISVLFSILALRLLDAPAEMLATLVTVVVAGAMFLVINNWWKISIHAAFSTGVAVMLTLLYGWPAALVALVPVPLVAWSRVALGQHSVWQVTAGAALAVVIQLAVFYFFGLL